MKLEAETLVAGRYRLLGRLGSGGMADVWCAEDTMLDRRVALKFLHDRFVQDEQFVERFRREASAAAGLTVGGLAFAGKTGTAEIDPEAGINRPWFIGFAPADDPQVAVAVMLERCQGCFGGTVAGQIATQVMESLLNR